LHGAALLFLLRLVVQRGLEQRSQDRVSRGAQVVQKSRCSGQLRLRQFVDQPV